jgi:hypothetical protein
MIKTIVAVYAALAVTVIFTAAKESASGVPNVGRITAVLGAHKLVDHVAPLLNRFLRSGGET